MVCCMKVLLLLFICFFGTKVVNAQISQKCGQTPIPPNIESKIIGGRLVKPYSWPWQISFYHSYNGKKFFFGCGGTIISENWIMTAGHCVRGVLDKPERIRIYTGVFDEEKKNEPGEVVHRIKAVHQHPLFYFNGTGLVYDIALLELFDPIKYDNHTQPICLPTQDSSTIVEPNTAWAIGWGVKNTSIGLGSRMLRQVNVPFVNIETCKKEYRNNDWKIVEKVMICASRTGKSPCQGDSGGPLVVKNKNNAAWFQYGITSWANGCALKGYANVFSRVTAYCDFIESTTNGAVKCQNPDTYL